jgi:serine/threonine-protein kinase
MDFISRDTLLEVMKQWRRDKVRPVSEILLARGAIEPADQIVLDQLVDRHIARHGGDARQSLSGSEIKRTARTTLAPTDDPELRESVGAPGDVEGTHVFGIGLAEAGACAGAGEPASGRYQILSLIDEGGLGRVFLARDRELNREVALKQMKEAVASSSQQRARFVFEAEVTGNLEHPGVVPVYGKGEYDDGRPYYAMQFIRGDNLKVAADQFHHDRGLAADPVGQSAELHKLLRRFLVVCETMAYAHSRGVIHRDLKPKNILLGPFGETLVVDWGLAKVVGRAENEPPSGATLRPPSSSGVEPTTAGARMGTAAYMSPEQARGDVEHLGQATDVYGLGATLYYLLTGRAAFDDTDNVEILLKVERGEFRSPREITGAVDRALDAICRKAMALKPADRYQSARALADDLESWLSDQPVAAYPEPAHTRAARWLRRHRKVAALLGAVLAAALLGVLYHDWKISHAEAKARDQLKITLGSLGYMLELCGVNLARLPNTEGMREAVANKGLEICQRLNENFPDDTGVRLETSQVYRVIAGVERITGRFDASRKAYGHAITILADLCKANPADSAFRSWLVEALIDRGTVLYMDGKTFESERDLNLAMVHAEPLKASGRLELHQRGKGMALINLAEIYVAKGKADEAVAAAESAVELLSLLAARAVPVPRTLTDRWLLVIALTDRGTAHHLKGDEAAALRDLERSDGLARDILRDDKDYHDAEFELARAWNLRAEWLAMDPSRLVEAEKRCNEAVTMLESLKKGHEMIPFYREQLALTLTNRARVRFLLGPARAGDALADCAAARKLADDLLSAAPKPAGNPHYLSILGRAYETESLVHHARGDGRKRQESLLAAWDKLERTIAIDDTRARDQRLLAEIRTRLAADGVPKGSGR